MSKDRPGYFQVTSHGTSAWRRQLLTDTGQVIASSPAVASKDSCLKSLKWLRTNIENLPIVDAEGHPFT
jgi:uncharacterized protein YegP (UPF0339 family)